MQTGIDNLIKNLRMGKAILRIDDKSAYASVFIGDNIWRTQFNPMITDYMIALQNKPLYIDSCGTYLEKIQPSMKHLPVYGLRFIILNYTGPFPDKARYSPIDPFNSLIKMYDKST